LQRHSVGFGVRISGSRALIRAMGNRNAFEGPMIESDIRSVRAPWRTVLFSCELKPLMQLRDLQDDAVNADNIYILTLAGKANALERLARSLRASVRHMTVGRTWFGRSWPQNAFESMSLPEHYRHSSRVAAEHEHR
jgi:hypothetical protein